MKKIIPISLLIASLFVFGNGCKSKEKTVKIGNEGKVCKTEFCTIDSSATDSDYNSKIEKAEEKIASLSIDEQKEHVNNIFRKIKEETKFGKEMYAFLGSIDSIKVYSLDKSASVDGFNSNLNDYIVLKNPQPMKELKYLLDGYPRYPTSTLHEIIHYKQDEAAFEDKIMDLCRKYNVLFEAIKSDKNLPDIYFKPKNMKNKEFSDEYNKITGQNIQNPDSLMKNVEKKLDNYMTGPPMVLREVHANLVANSLDYVTLNNIDSVSNKLYEMFKDPDRKKALHAEIDSLQIKNAAKSVLDLYALGLSHSEACKVIGSASTSYNSKNKTYEKVEEYVKKLKNEKNINDEQLAKLRDEWLVQRGNDQIKIKEITEKYLIDNFSH